MEALGALPVADWGPRGRWARWGVQTGGGRLGSWDWGDPAGWAGRALGAMLVASHRAVDSLSDHSSES